MHQVLQREARWAQGPWGAVPCAPRLLPVLCLVWGAGSPACSGWVGRSRVPPARGPARSITLGWELPPGSAGAPGSSLPHTSATAHRAGLRAAPGTDERRPQHLPARSGSRGSGYGRPGGRRHPANVSQQREGPCTVAGVTGSSITLEGRHPGSCWPFCVPVRNRGLRLRPRLGGQHNGLGAAGRALPAAGCAVAAPWGGRAVCAPLNPTALHCTPHPQSLSIAILFLFAGAGPGAVTPLLPPNPCLCPPCTAGPGSEHGGLGTEAITAAFMRAGCQGPCSWEGGRASGWGAGCSGTPGFS